MVNVRKSKTIQLILALSLLVAPVLSFIRVDAAQIVNRTISISSAVVSETNVTQTVSFTPASTTSLGSIVFEYCTNSPLHFLACTPPAGFSALGALLTDQNSNTGFSIDVPNTTANRVVLTRTPAATNTTPSSYELSNTVNPSTENQTVYVRIGLHSSIDGTGAAFDEGAVAFSTTAAFSVGVYVPPFLTFCVAETVALDCSTTSGSLLDFGEFSESTASATTMQFSVATNDVTGYNTFINGQTMTSGTNIITPLSTQTASVAGSGQFGLNLRANTDPSVGANIDGIGSGVPSAQYNTPNLFRFADGDLIASSPITTEFTRYTASYIVNIADTQPPGVYAATLTFTSVASF